MVHESLNPTLADWRMASSDNMDEVWVWKRHDKQRAAIESLMESNLEKETNHGEDMEGMRLACLLQKFTAFKSMKQVSKTLTIRMLAARELKDRRSMKKMYSFLTKLDVYRKQVLEGWSAKLAELKCKRKTCLAQMLYLFNEVSRRNG
ncbi:hypothetical protein DPEC_G00237670 [Dallia pectoralis]|uniref:Uncharacterized protein n=1 Tax=Dallia pectoralis TaxID=75939 RepID=A0ACC2FZ05_DALPE|nr:hypothetical protein DPEC_G00237670 [Dallia pectoralis]